MDDNDISITDEKGIMLKVSSNYGKHYGIDNSEILGKSVYELEKKKIFYPSVTNEVLREKKKVTLLQKNIFGQSMLVTGVPIFDENNKIKYVISFHSIDIANLCDFREKYEKMIEYMTAHYAEIMELKLKKMQTKEIISKSKKMNNIYKIITNIADTNANVLITGETGVGKNLFAKLIHKESNRVEKAFVEINCGTIPENLIESELFGYEKGSFTGADIKGKIGKVELANNGTLFLDEIGELPLNMQQKLLQVIQDKKIIRVGGTKYIDVDFRLVAATNKNLVELSEKGQFREDLYYRLNVVQITTPSLKEIPDDIPLLLEHFLKQYKTEYKVKQKKLSNTAIKLMQQYSWPGNIRELENLIKGLITLVPGSVIDEEHLPEYIK
ncbi:MAG: sigma 54-interacting transcriptional regulator, partial [Clostridia bacterium]|nr:sigma 54-interacting transcriptional regulator [Clostridia bacterium]